MSKIIPLPARVQMYYVLRTEGGRYYTGNANNNFLSYDPGDAVKFLSISQVEASLNEHISDMPYSELDTNEIFTLETKFKFIL